MSQAVKTCGPVDLSMGGVIGLEVGIGNGLGDDWQVVSAVLGAIGLADDIGAGLRSALKSDVRRRLWINLRGVWFGGRHC